MHSFGEARRRGLSPMVTPIETRQIAASPTMAETTDETETETKFSTFDAE